MAQPLTGSECLTLITNMTPTKPEDGVRSLLKSLNANTILILIMFAALWYLSQVFVTKEIYYRDQLKIDQTFKEVKDGQSRIIDILTSRNNNP